MSPRAKYKKVNRRMRVIKFRARGWTHEDIAKEIGVSERTVIRDMQSGDIQRFIDELIRRQLKDIEAAEPKDAMKYRDSLLDKLIPKRVEAKTRGEVRVSVDRGAEIEELLQSYDHLLTETGPEEGAIQEDDPGEPVHTPQTDG